MLHYILFIVAIIAVINIAYFIGFLTSNVYRISLFWFGCLPVRLLLTYFAYETPESTPLTLLTGGISIGLFGAFVKDEIKRQQT